MTSALSFAVQRLIHCQDNWYDHIEYNQHKYQQKSTEPKPVLLYVVRLAQVNTSFFKSRIR